MRDPAAIAAWEWWRLATSLIVQDGGAIGTLFNLGFLAVLGYVAERALGRGRWVVLYLSGAVAGEAAGFLLDQPGAGNSVALCGLAGGLVLMSGPSERAPLERALGAFYAVVSGAWLRPRPAPRGAGSSRSSWSSPRRSSSTIANACRAGRRWPCSVWRRWC